jgi:beta-catenin-like protein 1
MLDRRSKSLGDLIKTLQVYRDNVDDTEQVPEGAVSQKEILQGLIAFLEGC